MCGRPVLVVICLDYFFSSVSITIGVPSEYLPYLFCSRRVGLDLPLCYFAFLIFSGYWSGGTLQFTCRCSCQWDQCAGVHDFSV